jgi:hypothetical protein
VGKRESGKVQIRLKEEKGKGLRVEGGCKKKRSRKYFLRDPLYGLDGKCIV